MHEEEQDELDSISKAAIAAYMTEHEKTRDTCPSLVELTAEYPSQKVKGHLLWCSQCQQERRGLLWQNPMNRKHYQFVADTIRAEARAVMDNKRLTHTERMAAIDALDSLTKSFVDRFFDDNPRFDTSRFREAAGFEGRGRRRRNSRAANPIRKKNWAWGERGSPEVISVGEAPISQRHRNGLEIEVCAKCGMPMVSEAAWNGLDKTSQETYEFHRGGPECVPCVRL